MTDQELPFGQPPAAPAAPAGAVIIRPVEFLAPTTGNPKADAVLEKVVERVMERLTPIVTQFLLEELKRHMAKA